MPLRLSFDSGALAGIHIVTSAPMIRLGRDPQSNDILLSNPKVSRKHAVIERSVRGGYALQVLGTGPSTLNGDPVAAIAGRNTVHSLSTGDRLSFGGIEITVSEATVKLICVSGPTAGRELVLDGSVRVGSGHDCEFVLDDRQVAPEHLVITSTPLGFRAEPRAAMVINGAPAEPRVLSHGDELQLGTTTLRFIAQAAEDIGADASMSSSFLAGTRGTVTDQVGELIVLAGASKGERIPLGNEQIILGTRADCTVMLSDILASPLHCAISRSGDQFVATDLGSQSGTFINGSRITQGTVLGPGDLIAIGVHVLEARLLGGVTIAVKGATMFTTRADAGAHAGPQPRFVIESRVVNAPKIQIGRAPSCDVVIDHPSVSREHCTIEWSDGFTLRDTSSAGTYLDDRRVVRQQLPPSAVLRVHDTLFRIAVRGEVCTIERADAALAEAALDVARAHASLLTRNLAPGSLSMHAGGVEPMKTLFRMDVGALEQEIAARKKDLRRGAPAWRPSSDLASNRPMRGAVVLSVLAAIALGGAAILFGRGETLVNHPLSQSHASAAFAAKATGVTVCGSCHTAGARIDNARCATCHTAFAPRVAHQAEVCSSCHVEHRGPSPDHALHAQDSSARCHPNQHAAELGTGSPLPQPIAAGPLPPIHLDTAALHVAHTRRTVAGKVVGIGCTACHAKLAAGKLVEAKPGFACFRCHDGGATAFTTGCAQCHAREHATALVRLPPSDPGRAAVITTPTPVGSVGWALAIALVGGTPGLVFGGWLRLRRRRTADAMVGDLKAHPAEVVKRLVHSINDSKCVGCSLCVQACPASVLELVDHKSRVVNFDSCIQCKKCETACAFDALRMHDADKPPPMIPMPSIDAFHETPVAGMYLIGQASGTPQVKNATNLGRAVIQRMVQQGVRPGLGHEVGAELDVAIVGSGPAGLSAALTCIELGLSYVVLEKERAFSWTIRNYYHKGKEVMAEPHDIALEATLPHWDTSREELLGAWQQLVDQHRVDIRYQHSVLDVKPDGARFTVSLGDPKDKPIDPTGENPRPAGRAVGVPTPPRSTSSIGQITAARVVIAIGTLGNPRKLGCAGDELEKVKNSLVDPDEWIGKSILVVGGSDSAVEVVLALSAPERRNQVWFSTRGAKLEGIKPKNRKLIEDALAAGRFQIRYATQVAEVTEAGAALTYKEDGRREDLPNDVVFAMVGGSSPQKWLQQIGIPYVEKPHSWSPPRTDLIAQKTAEGLVSVRRLIRGKLGMP
jgi:thioredoxin reductase (NADPH)